ncbi:MAG: hypothetical protein ACRDPT_02800 [Streptomycetales bacterium]
MSARTLGPFEAVRDLTYDAPFPDLMPVRRNAEAPEETDVSAAVARELEPLRERIPPGMTVAVTAGSRGIADIATVVRAAGVWLRDAGAEPFIVPAMGSHGGATAEGQRGVLAHYGITEDTMGMPIRATMDTVDLGPVPGGPAVHLDRHASGADAILLVNRVKAHTDFSGPIESGLAKIAAIGLGKQRGAEGIHAYGSQHLGHWVTKVARRLADSERLLGGLALVENAHERTARVAFVEPDGVGGPAEEALLAEAQQLMGRIPFDELDVLVVDEMGKNKSGSGMDTNVIGRMMIRGSQEFERPRISTIAVLALTEESYGNAVGLGLADFIPFRVLEALDLRATYINAVTAGNGGVQRGQIPMALPTDRDAIAAAILMCGRPDPEGVRLARIRSTLETSELLVSESLRGELARHPDLEICGAARPMAFDGAGALTGWKGSPG